MLELASLLLYFSFVLHAQTLSKEALGQTVATNDIRGAFATPFGEFDDVGTVGWQLRLWFEPVMAWLNHIVMSVSHGRMRLRRYQAYVRHLLNREGEGNCLIH